MYKFFISTIISLLILWGSIRMTEVGESWGYLVYVLYILLMVTIIFILKKKRIKINILILILLLLYVFFSTVSSIINEDIHMMFTSILLLLLYLSLANSLPSLINNSDTLIMKSTTLVLSPLIFIPLLMNGLVSVPYQGIFYNTNSFGLVVSTIFTVILIKFLETLENYIIFKKTEKVLNIFLIFLFLLTLLSLIIISGSRTSLISSLSIAIFGVFLLVISLIKQKRFNLFLIRIPFYFIIIIITGLLLKNYTNIIFYLENNILNKFSRTINEGDVFNHRSYVWKVILQESGMFSQSIDQLLISPHNTFLSILSTNGWIPFLFFSMFFGLTVYYSYKYFMDIENKNRYFPILAITSFLILSMGEVMLYKSSMIIAFVAIGMVSNNKVITFVSR